MTSPFDIRNDAPGLLRAEAMGITLKFDRTGPSTGRVSWNIPTPATGCTAETQAYCGIIITVDATSNDSTKLPKQGVMYSSDATVDANLFAGDTIGTSKVVGAFYQDRGTNFLDISGLRENAPYFVSGFPVDCELRYYQPGVHAYSLDYHQDGTQPTSGTQSIVFNMGSADNGGVQPTDTTGLDVTKTYTFTVKRGLVPKPGRVMGSQECVPQPWAYTISVPGATATTFDDLLHVIQAQLETLENPPQGPASPNTGSYYFNSANNTLYTWDGVQHIAQPVIIQATPPNVITVGTYWFDTTLKVLNHWDGVTPWAPAIVLTGGINPAKPECETSYWFDGAFGYTWTGNAWLKHTTVIQNSDPSLFVPVPCGSFWYDTAKYDLRAWDEPMQLWVSTNAVQYSEAPNQLTTGAYWFNHTQKKLMQWSGSAWVEQTTARITEVEPTLTVVAGAQWYNPATSSLNIRNLANTGWTATDFILFDTDPTQVTYCSNWWNTTTDQMFVWDGVHSTWNIATHFYQQAADPTSPPLFAEGDLWYDLLNNKLFYWQNNCFRAADFTLWMTDPRTTIPDGTIWHDTASDLWFSKSGPLWVPINITFAASDPSALAAGTVWLNITTSSLQAWNGISWVSLTYSPQPLTPAVGAKWFNSTTKLLMEWDGYNWVRGLPVVTVDFNCYGNFIFADTSKGSLSWCSIKDTDLFSSLSTTVYYDNPRPGSDGISSEPLYEEVGIGTDGTNDERLQLQKEIRYAFGYPVVDVELTPEQLDFCIDQALQTLRENSSIAYSRGFFFLNIQAETQRYLLTNKVSGMNKIVDILGIHRLTSSFLASAHGAGVYGQIVLQHLYNMGTFDLLSYHIMTEYTKTMEILFAGRITWNWNEQSRELHIHHRFAMNERMCLVDAVVERTEQQIMSDRICRPWIRKWAIAEASMILANTRGKFQTLPGAGGGVSLNASDLRQQAATDKEQCMADIFDFVVENPEEWGIMSTLTFG